MLLPSLIRVYKTRADHPPLARLFSLSQTFSRFPKPSQSRWILLWKWRTLHSMQSGSSKVLSSSIFFHESARFYISVVLISKCSKRPESIFSLIRALCLMMLIILLLDWLTDRRCDWLKDIPRFSDFSLGSTILLLPLSQDSSQMFKWLHRLLKLTQIPSQR